MKILSDNHWILENYRQRLTRKEWKQVLLDRNDEIFFYGEPRRLVAKYMGCGIYEVYKNPKLDLTPKPLTRAKLFDKIIGMADHL